jgi:hypothetical protein
MIESPVFDKLNADLLDAISRLLKEVLAFEVSFFISKLNNQKWTVTTWSKQMQFASVMKKGTVGEKTLANVNKMRYNRPHENKWK